MDKHEYLYRLRLQWAPDGELALAETVHKTQFVDAGKVVGAGEDRVTTVTPAKMSKTAQAALDAFAKALASDQAEAEAEAKRKAAAEEAAAKKAAEKAEADRKAAEEAAKEKT